MSRCCGASPVRHCSSSACSSRARLFQPRCGPSAAQVILLGSSSPCARCNALMRLLRALGPPTACARRAGRRSWDLTDARALSDLQPRSLFAAMKGCHRARVRGSFGAAARSSRSHQIDRVRSGVGGGARSDQAGSASKWGQFRLAYPDECAEQNERLAVETPRVREPGPRPDSSGVKSSRSTVVPSRWSPPTRRGHIRSSRSTSSQDDHRSVRG